MFLLLGKVTVCHKVVDFLVIDESGVGFYGGKGLEKEQCLLV